MLFSPRQVYHIDNFPFENGDQKNKYCLILSDSQKYIEILFTLTTSLVDKYKAILPPEEYVIIPKGEADFLASESMIRIDTIKSYDVDTFKKLSLKLKGVFPEKYWLELIEKIQRSPRVKSYIKRYIKP